MNIVAIIQARMDSTRFPEKMRAFLGDLTIIEWVILRVKKAKLLDNIVLATSDDKSDDYLIDIANKHKIKNFRGSKEDVLNRFIKAASQFNADHVVRICADNPFICYELIDDLVRYYLSDNYDLVFNHSPQLNSNFVDGFGAEIMPFNILNKISEEACLNVHKEHVTKYIYDNYNEYNISTPPCPKELSFPHLSFDVDEVKDLKKLNNLLNSNHINVTTSAKDILKIYSKNY